MTPRQAVLEEDEEVAQKIEAFKGPAPLARIIQCPDCSFNDADPERIGQHLERHRPVGLPIWNKKGKLISTLCPKGCGRYFNRAADASSMRDQAINNVHRELPFHSENCDGSPRLPTTMEEEAMAKTKGRSFKRKDKPASAAPSTLSCPACQDLTFENLRHRGAHYRTQHPGWQEDPRFNPEAAPRIPLVRDPLPMPMVPEIPFRKQERPLPADAEGDPILEGRKLVERMRARAIVKRAQLKSLEEEADNLDATADAMEKALEN